MKMIFACPLYITVTKSIAFYSASLIVFELVLLIYLLQSFIVDGVRERESFDEKEKKKS